MQHKYCMTWIKTICMVSIDALNILKLTS